MSNTTTPKTDAAKFDPDEDCAIEGDTVVAAVLARQLETELSAALKERDDAIRERESCHSIYDRILELCGYNKGQGYPALEGAVKNVVGERDSLRAQLEEANLEFNSEMALRLEDANIQVAELLNQRNQLCQKLAAVTEERDKLKQSLYAAEKIADASFKAVRDNTERVAKNMQPIIEERNRLRKEVEGMKNSRQERESTLRQCVEALEKELKIAEKEIELLKLRSAESPKAADIIRPFGSATWQRKKRLEEALTAAKAVTKGGNEKCATQLSASSTDPMSSQGNAAPTSDPLDAAKHPEDTCSECGRDNVVWFAPSELWNSVVRSREIQDPILCPCCFIKRAEKCGFSDRAWMVQPE